MNGGRGGDGPGRVDLPDRPDRPDAVEMRAGRPDDAVAVADVFAAARAEMRYLPELHSRQEHVTFFSTRVLPTSRVTVAVAEADRAVVAFSAVRDGWLEHLYVVPAQQGGGIGGVLLRRAMNDNPTGLRLWAFAANVRAIAFYGRAGFAEVLRTDGSRNEERQPDVQMHWAGDSTRSAAKG
jgi:GNAT superfamily N-acetyltransferase